MATSPTTNALVRDRMLTVIEELVPTSDTQVRFERHQNDGRGDFIEWAESQPAAAYRRFQVRTTGSLEPPETSSGVEEERQITFTITVAYPLDHRYGGDLALDRDDIMDEDERRIENAIGMHGRANFTPPTYPDATWLGGGVDREEAAACGFLVITQRMAIIRSLP